jgi:glucose-6-phosphate isomerase
VGSSITLALGAYAPAVAAARQRLAQDGVMRRIWAKDAALWSADPEEQARIGQRLGWLTIVDTMRERIPQLTAFADEVRRAGFTSAVVLGMGGSSLGAEVFSSDFTTAPGYPELYVLDSTDPQRVLMVHDGLDPRKTLYIVSSKSGTTMEVLALFKYFWGQVQGARGDRAGEHFITITDPGTPLEDLAREHNFRRVWTNPPDIGGRYGVLSYFGLVPAALMGVNLAWLLAQAKAEMDASGPDAEGADAGLWLGAALGTLARQGRDKATFVIDDGIATFGPWVEHLIAESTGKAGTGVLPVEGEALGPPEVYGDDRVFIYLWSDDGGGGVGEALDALAEAGHPVITIELRDKYDLGSQFFRWELATAVLGHLLGVNPFDEPDVAASKEHTQRLLDTYRQKRRLPEEEPAVEEGLISLYGGPEGSEDLADALAGFLRQLQPGDYLALQAYLDPSDETLDLLDRLRTTLRDNLRVATTLGYGPRFLHATGQFHKGGPPTGVFVQITVDEAVQSRIPGEDYSFATLIRAQALGDLEALRARNRRVVRLHLAEAEEGLEQLAALIEE